MESFLEVYSLACAKTSWEELLNSNHQLVQIHQFIIETNRNNILVWFPQVRTHSHVERKVTSEDTFSQCTGKVNDRPRSIHYLRTHMIQPFENSETTNAMIMDIQVLRNTTDNCTSVRKLRIIRISKRKTPKSSSPSTVSFAFVHARLALLRLFTLWWRGVVGFFLGFITSGMHFFFLWIAHGESRSTSWRTCVCMFKSPQLASYFASVDNIQCHHDNATSNGGHYHAILEHQQKYGFPQRTAATDVGQFRQATSKFCPTALRSVNGICTIWVTKIKSMDHISPLWDFGNEDAFRYHILLLILLKISITILAEILSPSRRHPAAESRVNSTPSSDDDYIIWTLAISSYNQPKAWTRPTSTSDKVPTPDGLRDNWRNAGQQEKLCEGSMESVHATLAGGLWQNPNRCKIK